MNIDIMSSIRRVYLFLCIGCIFTFACNILDKKPEMDITANNVIHDLRSAENALNGVYNKLKGDKTPGMPYYGAMYLILSDVSSDISQSIGTYNALIQADNFDLSPSSEIGIGDFWAQVYKVINGANEIITDLPALTNVDQENKDNILGQAYFLRALAYFDLNRSFGGVAGVYGTMGVPIVLKPVRSIKDITYPSRPSIDEVYERVESDLKNSVNLLSGGGEPTLASQAAAEALLSRLYLYYKQDYNLVEEYATDVINDYNYKLTENYTDIFIKENTAGSIFELNNTTTFQSEIRNWYFPSSKGGRGELVLHEEFVKLLKSRPSDDRTKLIAHSNSSDRYYPTKYQKPSGTDNIQILRLAEMFFNRAEARVRKKTPNISGALSDLNVIRNRAGLADTSGSGVDSPEKILHAIAVERSIEFYEEGHRWFNLIRTGKALRVLKDIKRKNGPPVSLGSTGHEVFPIPQEDLDVNDNLEQNPAYK
jgi:hypothetical protein